MLLPDQEARDVASARLTRRSLLAAASAITCTFILPGAAAHDRDAAPTGKLILLGTQGGPNFNLTRGETASALLVGERLYLVDCGYGTRAALYRAGLKLPSIDAIFLTHLHDDHTSDLSTLLTNMATQSRSRTITIYGPPGTNQLVDAIRASLTPNATIRIADEARPAGFLDFIESVEVEPGAPFLQDGEMQVTCARNTHYPAEIEGLNDQRSFAYRFDWGSSVVFSGDTTYSEELVALARGADVFVCEVLEPKTMRQAFEMLVAGGAFAGAEEGVWLHMIGTHSSPAQAGQMAAEAGVGRLVINHLAPGSLLETPDNIMQQLVGETFSGPVIVGHDDMAIDI